MKIKKDILLKALQIVKPGLDSKDIVSQATSFAFRGGRVTTFNDEISISHPIEGIDFEGAIKAEELYGLLSKITQPEVVMTVEKDEVRVTAGRVKAGLRLEAEIKMPTQDVDDDEWEAIENKKDFLKYLILAAQNCSSDISESKMTCVCVRDNTIIGSDNFRLFKADIDEAFSFDELLLPAQDIFALSTVNPDYIQVGEGWVHFMNEEGTVFSCRKVNESYVSEDQIEVVTTITKGINITFPNKVVQVVERIIPFAKRGSVMEERIEIGIKGGKAIFKGNAIDTGSWIEEKLTIDCKDEIEFNITPAFFIDILKQTHTLVVSKDRTKGKFQSDNWEYLLMLRTADV